MSIPENLRRVCSKLYTEQRLNLNEHEKRTHSSQRGQPKKLISHLPRTKGTVKSRIKRNSHQRATIFEHKDQTNASKRHCSSSDNAPALSPTTSSFHSPAHPEHPHRPSPYTPSQYPPYSYPYNACPPYTHSRPYPCLCLSLDPSPYLCLYPALDPYPDLCPDPSLVHGHCAPTEVPSGYSS